MSAVENVINRNRHLFCPVVPFDRESDKILSLDLTRNNPDLNDELLADTPRFAQYLNRLRKGAHARYLAGGYDELRSMYARSSLFNESSDGHAEPRRLHLGMDIWGEAGTPVMAPVGGTVHSFAFNNHFGDYGATIILSHQLEGVSFYSLYGHLSLADIRVLSEGQYMAAGTPFAHFGEASENGHWPPHLHFQIIVEIGVHKGDYPGVCRLSERAAFLANSPDPAVLTGLF